MQNLTSTNRSKKIGAILEQRRPLRQKIATIGDNLRSLLGHFDNLTQQRFFVLFVASIFLIVAPTAIKVFLWDDC